MRIRTLEETWQALWHPTDGFRDRARSGEDLGSAVLSMLVWRVPWTFASWLWSLNAYRVLRQSLLSRSWNADGRIPTLGLSLEDLRAFAEALPELPSTKSLLLWLLPIAALFQVGVWMHHVVWDHAALWILRGVKHPQPWQRSTQAEAEALQVGALGLAVGLLGHLPLVGCVLAPLLMAVGLWFWIQRGLALAVWHDCPPWKGIAATLLHVPLVLTFYGLLSLITLLLVALMAAL